MNTTTIAAFVAGIALTAVAVPRVALTQSEDQKKLVEEMMAKARRWTQPGDNHKVLERFLGRWNTEVKLAGSSQGEKGTTECTWLIKERWLQMHGKGTMMGMPSETFYVLGYDNFKMSFVTTAVTNMDTAMLSSEGDMDPSGEVLITYGTLDEYLTGEHDKMVKYVWRFHGKDKIVCEVHDLPIGEKNTKVVEIAYTRAN
ncbi:MAG: DUF1579 family protein [Planctomycetes bacterium]|nr:DUF1579 family protein [Planctomycetota bacterium]